MFLGIWCYINVPIFWEMELAGIFFSLFFSKSIYVVCEDAKRSCTKYQSEFIKTCFLFACFQISLLFGNRRLILVLFKPTKGEKKAGQLEFCLGAIVTKSSCCVLNTHIINTRLHPSCTSSIWFLKTTLLLHILACPSPTGGSGRLRWVITETWQMTKLQRGYST